MSTEGGRPVLGVIGGMGPGATADFLMRLARQTPAQRDQDHLPTLVYSDPSTPDRSDAMLSDGPSPLPALLRGVDFLNNARCAAIVIPCNSAHNWYDQLADASTAPILHIVDATADRLERLGVATVGLMATDGTTQSGVYNTRLERFNIRTLDLTDVDATNPIMRGIRAYKAGDEPGARELLLHGGKQLIQRGAEALVFACTDISAALADVTTVDDTPVVDASDCLASACVDHLASPD